MSLFEGSTSRLRLVLARGQSDDERQVSRLADLSFPRLPSLLGQWLVWGVLPAYGCRHSCGFGTIPAPHSLFTLASQGTVHHGCIG